MNSEMVLSALFFFTSFLVSIIHRMHDFQSSEWSDQSGPEEKTDWSVTKKGRDST